MQDKTPGKTLKEHLTGAVRARWAKTTEEARKEHSAKMTRARWPKKPSSTGEPTSDAKSE